MSEDKEMTLVFAPGCFDSFEGTQEELEELIESIKTAFENGELLDTAEEVDLIELEEEYPDVLAQLHASDSTSTRKLH